MFRFRLNYKNGAKRTLECELVIVHTDVVAINLIGGPNPVGGAPGQGQPPPGGSGSPAPPAPSFTFSPNAPPSGPKAGQTVAFDGSGSSDPDGTVSSWAWAFGGPLFGGGGAPSGASASGANAANSFSAPGVYPATLTVTDNGGHTNSTSQNLFVSGPGSRQEVVQFACPNDPGESSVLDLPLLIPTYAEEPASEHGPNPCPNSPRTVTIDRLETGNPFGIKDAWGRDMNSWHVRMEWSPQPGPEHQGDQVVRVTWK